MTNRSRRRALPAIRCARSLRVGLLQVHVATLQGDREPEDGGERRPQVVGHGLEEGVLHVVQRAQTLGRFPLDVEGAFQLGLRFLALGDVQQEALPVRGPCPAA